GSILRRPAASTTASRESGCVDLSSPGAAPSAARSVTNEAPEEQMPRHFGYMAAVIGAALWLPTALPASAWTGTIVCESHGYRRNFCRVDTEGRVRLVREISTGNHCRQGQGRGWWFDHSGIWVDRGCRGVFEFGRGRGGPPNNNSNAAIAAGIGALL